MRTNIIYQGDVLDVLADPEKIPDESIHLVVTSPPYNVGKPYNEHGDTMTLEAYLDWMQRVIAAIKPKLVVGGRVCWNIANTGRKPYVPLNAYFTMAFLDAGYFMTAENIWDKGRAVAAGKTAWGSWKDATSPWFRDCHEYVQVYSNVPDTEPAFEYVQVYYKDEPKLDCSGFPKSTAITGHDFSLESMSVWDIPPETSRKIRAVHPAPYPVGVPKRCIEFLTRPGQTVLDPFTGAGTTLVACKILPEPRRYVGIDIDPAYVKFARRRLASITGPKLTMPATNGLEAFLP